MILAIPKWLTVAPVDWRWALLLLCVSMGCAAEPTVITITGHDQVSRLDPYYFYEKILTLALEKTRITDGDFTVQHNNHGGGIERDRAMLTAGVGIDVMWASVTAERAKKMRVVPVDLLKNLDNYRVLLINKDDQPLFNNINTLEDLKKLTVGSGVHWTDGRIMKDNGFNVLTSSNYYGLFKMLAARRFNFISRGLHEIGFDTSVYAEFGLVQEQHLLLQYDVPIQYCFFVNKDNQKLADRLERGLKIAQADGSFDEEFRQMPSFLEGEDILRHSHRRIIQIKNTSGNDSP